MQSNWSIEEAKVLLYLSEKSQDYTDLNGKARRALLAWQQDLSLDAKNVLLFWCQSSSAVADHIFSHLNRELCDEINLRVNLDLLEDCASPRVSQPAILDELWSLFGSTEASQLAEQIAHIIVNLLPNFAKSGLRFPFQRWWPLIYAALRRTEDKIQTSAGLKVWLACLSSSLKASDPASQSVISEIIESEGDMYFEILEKYVSKASKIALQILNLSFAITRKPILNHYMNYNPNITGVKEAWVRYISLVEIMGIDTSAHQTADGLPDFAALLSSNSPIPYNWAISLINVGLCQSNNEGIRVYVMHLVMALQQDQLGALAKCPSYVAGVIFPKLLQTPNFVILNDRCLQAEHLEEFTKNMLLRLISEGTESLREFIYEYAQFLLEHAHGFEAPRVLVSKVCLDVLPPRCLTSRESTLLLAAGRATVLTYNSKALADLYFSLVQQIVAKAGPTQGAEHEVVNSVDLQSLKAKAEEEWNSNGFLSKQLYDNLKGLSVAAHDATFHSDHTQNEQMPSVTLLDLHPRLQVSLLNQENALSQDLVREVVELELASPKAMSAAARMQQSAAFETAFDYLHETSYETCEEVFAAFNIIDTRHAALRCFKRSNPKKIPLRDFDVLWTHIKDATLRIVDRDFHLTFLDLLTSPNAVDEEEPPIDICSEIIELSVLKRNLLVPLTRGLARWGSEKSSTPEKKVVPSWIMILMSRIFAFVRSPEYSVRLEEMVANEFGIYESSWGEPESHARAIAAEFLHRHSTNVNQKACDDAARDTLSRADLKKLLTGSLDNLDAHRRVLYYQTFLLLQRGCSKALAMNLIDAVQESLESEANPPVRLQGEWLVGVVGAIHIAPSHADFTDFVMRSIRRLKLEAGVPPRVLGSLIRISMLLYYSSVKRSTGDLQTSTKIGEELVLHLLPLATTNKAVVRHRAISALYILNKNGLAPKSLEAIVASVSDINEGGVKHSSYQNEAFMWDVLDLRLGPVCGGICSTVFDRYMPNTLLETDFVAILGTQDIVGPCWSKAKIQKPNRHKDSALPEVIEFRERIVAEAVKFGASTQFSRQIQTKSGTFDVEYQARRTSLVVVASLCDKPVNLGAITRLSDALGACELAVRDKAVLEDPHFKSTALTAEKWIQIEQVSEDELASYLARKKTEGYTLVGIEQTDTSKTLRADLQFPEKTLLMMGHERQGIPAEILGVLDACVEIEQLGYVRSMNIQTATAVVVQAYNQNHSADILRVGYANP